MKCFNHADAAAVGCCLACGKGLCPQCLDSCPAGVGCKGACMERVRILADEERKRAQDRYANKRSLQLLAIGFLLCALTAPLPFLSIQEGISVAWGPVAFLGGFMLVTAAVCYRISRFYPSEATRPKGAMP
jgi:hypothetical protein